MDHAVRRFNLLDAVVLIAALAAAIPTMTAGVPRMAAYLSGIQPSLISDSRYIHGVLLGRPPASRLDSTRILMISSMTEVVGGPSRDARSGLPPRGQALVILHEATVLAFPLLVYGSVALVLLRLRRPRPGWPALLRQSGFSACMGAVAAIVCVTWAEQSLGIRVSIAAVSAVVGLIWVGLALARLLVMEKSWFDRAGRVIGVCWLGVGIIAAA